MPDTTPYGRKDWTTMVDHHDTTNASAPSADTGFLEPPTLRRLGTLAELTQGAIGSGDDAMGGLSGDVGSI
jgi:hypothetical protein